MKKMRCVLPPVPANMVQETIPLLLPIHPEEDRQLPEGEAGDYWPEVAEEEVTVAARNIANRKAPGLLGVPPEAVKILPTERRREPSST